MTDLCPYIPGPHKAHCVNIIKSKKSIEIYRNQRFLECGITDACDLLIFNLNLPDDDDDARVHLKYHGSIAGSHYP